MSLLSQRKIKKTSKNFHEVLLENIRGLVFVKDQDYRLVYANKAFLELYSPEQRGNVVGFHSADHFTEDEARVFNAEDKKAFETGFSEIVEEISNYEGQTFIFQTQKIRYTDEKDNVRILGIATDITKLVEREKLLAKSNVALENFAGVAAHDLRSPLSALSVSIEILKNDSETNFSQKAMKHLDLMRSCLDGLMDQVTQLLATYKLGTEDRAPHTVCDLSVLLEEVKFNLSTYIQNANAKILSTELPVVVVNKPLFRQLMHNLIENSLKYRSHDRPLIILRYADDGDDHLFSFEDNGLGISIENREKIFGFTTQLKRKSDGYGIGLSLCRKIVEMHGGKIWLDENFSDGCKICFTIPKQC